MDYSNPYTGDWSELYPEDTDVWFKAFPFPMMDASIGHLPAGQIDVGDAEGVGPPLLRLLDRNAAVSSWVAEEYFLDGKHWCLLHPSAEGWLLDNGYMSEAMLQTINDGGATNQAVETVAHTQNGGVPSPAETAGLGDDIRHDSIVGLSTELDAQQAHVDRTAPANIVRDAAATRAFSQQSLAGEEVPVLDADYGSDGEAVDPAAFYQPDLAGEEVPVHDSDYGNNGEAVDVDAFYQQGVAGEEVPILNADYGDDAEEADFAAFFYQGGVGGEEIDINRPASANPQDIEGGDRAGDNTTYASPFPTIPPAFTPPSLAQPAMPTPVQPAQIAMRPTPRKSKIAGKDRYPSTDGIKPGRKISRARQESRNEESLALNSWVGMPSVVLHEMKRDDGEFRFNGYKQNQKCARVLKAIFEAIFRLSESVLAERLAVHYSDRNPRKTNDKSEKWVQILEMRPEDEATRAEARKLIRESGVL